MQEINFATHISIPKPIKKSIQLSNSDDPPISMHSEYITGLYVDRIEN